VSSATCRDMSAATFPAKMFDTSDFALSHQPPSSGRRTTISVAMSHPAAAARRLYMYHMDVGCSLKGSPASIIVVGSFPHLHHL